MRMQQALVAGVGVLVLGSAGPALGADDTSDWELTSACKTSDDAGQLRVTGKEDTDFTLERDGGDASEDGTTGEDGAAKVTVPSDSADDTWVLYVDDADTGAETKIRDESCDGDDGDDGEGKPDEDRFSLAFPCRIDADTTQLRITNDSSEDQEFHLSLDGGDLVLNEAVGAGDPYVTSAPVEDASDTWVLEIAGHEYSQEVGNHPPCEDDQDNDRDLFRLASLCRTNEETGQLRVVNDSDADRTFTVTQDDGDLALRDTTVTAGEDFLVADVPIEDSSDTWTLDIAGHEISTAIGDNPLCADGAPPPAGSDGGGDRDGRAPSPGGEDPSMPPVGGNNDGKDASSPPPADGDDPDAESQPPASRHDEGGDRDDTAAVADEGGLPFTGFELGLIGVAAGIVGGVGTVVAYSGGVPAFVRNVIRR